MAALKDDLQRAVTGLKGQPLFNDFVKTLRARREQIVNALIVEQDQTKVDVLRGEVRGYDFIFKAIDNQE
jgi:hypothetical protein